MIQATDLVVRHGQSTALDHVSLTVGPGEMVALVGPNGAGKTTFVDTLSGIVRPTAGTVRIEGRLAHVPEGRQLFAQLSVEDNLALGAWGLPHRDPQPVYTILPELRRLAHQRAGSLSGGQQQMVAIGRALMAQPDIIAVDELSLGLAPKIVTDLATHLRDLNNRHGTAVLLIEQNARLAFTLCSRAYVLEAGRVAAHGPCDELANSSAVARAYLGGDTGEDL